MKKNIFFNVCISLILIACSSSNEPKEISPTSIEFTSGELAKYIEVVDEPAQLSYSEVEGVIATQYIKLKVKLKLIKEIPELKDVDAHDIDFTSLLSVATINLVDENETEVQDISVKSEDLLKLKKLLKGTVNDEEVITFEGEFHNSDDAPKWFEQTTAFTPNLTGDITFEKSNINSFIIDGTHNMHGTVDKYPITMHLEIEGSSVKGSYYYDKQGADATLKLHGYNEDGILTINETDNNDTPTGHFKGKISDGVFKGEFTNNKGTKMLFVVAENGAESSSIEMSASDEGTFGLNNVLLPSQLKGKVEVINAEKSVGDYGYPSMTVTFKLLSKVNTSSMLSEYGQMWIVGIGQTENGIDVKQLLPNYGEWRSGDSDGKDFKDFLESDPGETITLEFTGDKDSSDDVSADLEKVKKFKLKITN